MATTQTGTAPIANDDPATLDRLIDPGPPFSRRDEARLAGYGTPVWAVIAYLQGPDGGVARTASAFHVPEISVRAAIAYYDKHRAVIDARIVLNSAENEP
jgi:uncharacterized protein (DUF433 family)